MEKWQNSQTLATWLIVICVVVFLLAFWIVRLFHLGFARIVQTELKEARQQLHHREQLLEVQEQERMRFAADLHDGLIGKLLVAQLKHQLPDRQQELDGLLKEIIDDARRISHDLSPPLIEHSSLPDLIAGIIDPWQKAIPVRFEQDIRAEETLPDRIKIQFVRILQELLTNAIKHSEADHISIRLRYTPQWVVLRISDNGKGIAASTGKGIGLHNVGLRMQHIGGHYRVQSTKNKGVSVLLTLRHATIPVS
jgi:signal transduction histidine kinase